MAMPAYVASQQALTCKLITNYPGNSGTNVPTHMATVLLFDEATGSIRAVSACHLAAQTPTCRHKPPRIIRLGDILVPRFLWHFTKNISEDCSSVSFQVEILK